MNNWTSEELDKINAVEEIEIAPLQPTGKPGKPVTIWVVRLGDELYVRSYRGEGGAWYQDALASGKGFIWAGGLEQEVDFVEISDPGINDQIDAAYRAKYRQYPQYVSPMVEPEVRATTMKLVTRQTKN
jgi:hypothetical protein